MAKRLGERAKGKEMLAQARIALDREANADKARGFRWFFKNLGDDVFLGVPVPVIRKIAKGYDALPLRELKLLMRSRVHEERTLAHAILRRKFAAGGEREKEILFKYYLRNRFAIRNWDGVDDSAPYIVGAWLLERDKSVLDQLACSRRIWDRRIAIVATLWFIRHGQTARTFHIAQMLFGDPEDLIHKATGWMLREAGKRDLPALRRFLKAHHQAMPRTMFRYAIERFPEEERNAYLLRESPRPRHL